MASQGRFVFAAALLLSVLNALPAAAQVPTPTVTGPVTGVGPGDASHNYPFYATFADLRAHGYVEEEFFIEGMANRYNTPAGQSGSVIDGNHPYKTRIVVRRPATAARFNGTVIVEWNNVTAGYDLDIDWFQTSEHLLRSGYAWVGVTPQRVGVEALKTWSPARYGSLDVTHGGTITNDALSYDAFAQAAAALRTPGRVNVMGGLGVERIFATGHSQSAGRLATYVNAIHPLAPVFDAVVVHGGGGRIRTDLTIPVWKLLAETDVLGSQAASRQPDTGRFRSWEVAGSSHVDIKFTASSRQLSTRDRPTAANTGTAPTARGNLAGAPASQPAPTGGCDRPPYSHVPFHHVMNAAFDHLVRWVKDGTLPPSAPPIELTSVSPATAARDVRGNALGGIRLAEHAVPTAVNTGLNSGAGFCRLNGSHEPFDAATLASLYPNRAAYVDAVRRVTEQNLKAGYILKADADATIAAAERSTTGAPR